VSFLKTDEGAFVALSDVREARPNSKMQIAVKMRSGEERTVSRAEWDEAYLHARTHVVPATQGTVLLHAVRDGKKDWIVRQPVLAWRVSVDGTADAITTTGAVRMADSCPAFQMPDGTVEDILGFYDSYEDWLAAVRADAV